MGNDAPIFGTADLLVRTLAARLPARPGYALTRILTPRIDAGRRRWLGERAAAAVLEYLEDPAAARATADRFVVELACDDLDGLATRYRSESTRRGAVSVHGVEHIPANGPLVLTSFHFSGGFGVFDLLRASGRNPLFLHAPVEPRSRPYPRRMAEARSDYLRRHFDPAWIEPGPGAREALDRTLSEGGTVVGLLDVAPDRLEVRDRLPGQLLGRPLELPAGLLRLAADHRATVVPYHGRLENDVRILEIEPPLHGRSVEDLVEQTLARCEAVIRKRPWIWQNWLDVDGLFAFRESGPGDRSEE